MLEIIVSSVLTVLKISLLIYACLHVTHFVSSVNIGIKAQDSSLFSIITDQWFLDRLELDNRTYDCINQGIINYSIRKLRELVSSEWPFNNVRNNSTYQMILHYR